MKTQAAMPVTAPEPVETHRWTRRQYERMVKAGVLTEDDRVELLDGLIVPMSPQNSRHATAVGLCRRALETLELTDMHVRTQAPLALGSVSEPEPDLAVVRGDLMDYQDHHPTSALLVVEVSDSSLAKDREQKRRLYAVHGTPEYWIVNLIDHHLEVYRDPASSDYKTKATHERSDTVATGFAPEAALSVEDFIST